MCNYPYKQLRYAGTKIKSISRKELTYPHGPFSPALFSKIVLKYSECAWIYNQEESVTLVSL